MLPAHTALLPEQLHLTTSISLTLMRRYDTDMILKNLYVFQLSYCGQLGGSVLLAGWLRVCASLPAAALQLSI